MAVSLHNYKMNRPGAPADCLSHDSRSQFLPIGKAGNATAFRRSKKTFADHTTVTVPPMHRSNGTPFWNRQTAWPIGDHEGDAQCRVGALNRNRCDRDADGVVARLQKEQNRMHADLPRSTSTSDGIVGLSHNIGTLRRLCKETKCPDTQSGIGSVPPGSFVLRQGSATGHAEGRSGKHLNVRTERVVGSVKSTLPVGVIVSEPLTGTLPLTVHRIENGLVEGRMPRLSAGSLRMIVSDGGIGISSEAMCLSGETAGSRILQEPTESLEGRRHPGCDATGNIIAIDVPAGASISE